MDTAMGRDQRGARPGTLGAARDWLDTNEAVALATVIATWGSAPVPVGGQMAIVNEDLFAGSVSGGCVENDVIGAAGGVIASGEPQRLAFGVADETAWRAGLPCGGKIEVFVERLDRGSGAAFLDRIAEAAVARRSLVRRNRLADGATELFEVNAQNPSDVSQAFRDRASRVVATPDGDVFVQSLAPPLRVLIIGATHIAQVLAGILDLAGYEVIVVDPRTAYASVERFPGRRLMTDWPQDALPRLGLDPLTAVVTLAHNEHLDDEALRLALPANCLYVGALGSKRSQAKRTERLAAAGLAPNEIAKLRAPVGLDIGARTPPEIALSIAAEIVLAYRGAKSE